MSFLQGYNFTTFPNLGLGFGSGTSTYSHSTPFGTPNRFSTSTSTIGHLNNISPAHIQQNLHQYQNIPIPQSIQPTNNLNQQPQLPQQQRLQQSNLDYYGNPISHQQQQQIPQQQLRSSSNAHINDDYDTVNIDADDNSNYISASQSPTANTNYYQPPQVQQQPQPQQQFQNQAPVQAPRRRKSKKVSQRNIVHYPADLRVTPIQGPIYAKDGFVPVVPLYSYSAVSNGTFYQIPILWTALSVALGLEVRGEILRGLPCIKRLNQLFCPTAGNTYPLDSIERFIDENKALIKRMYGEFVMLGGESYGPVGGTVGNLLRRNVREVYEDEVPNYFTKAKQPNGHFKTETGNHTHAFSDKDQQHPHVRNVRQTVNPRTGGPTEQPKSNRVDTCESKVEVVTPYWAANSGGKVRAIVNTQHFEQAIHQEVCAKTSTPRCTDDCGCEQKYKWHRLLAYDPDNDCKGIFMDWFLFPSCCVCRCNPTSK